MLKYSFAKHRNTNLSDSPSHFDIKSDDDTEKNVELFASVATAFAIYDLPVPGGPNSKIPRHGFLLPTIKKKSQKKHKLFANEFPFINQTKKKNFYTRKSSTI